MYYLFSKFMILFQKGAYGAGMLCVLITMTAYAPHKPKRIEQQATELLEQINTQQPFRATFTLTQHSNSTEETEKVVIEGTLTLQNEQYYVALAQQEIWCNGTTLWTYLPQAQEVQINTIAENCDVITPQRLLTGYQEDYQTVALQEINSDNRRTYVIELKAKDSTNEVTWLRMWVDKKTITIRHVEALTQDQTSFSIDIHHVEKGLSLEKSYFSFDPTQYPNVEVIDLR